MCTSIVLIGCLQPSRLAPERAPVVETAFNVTLDKPGGSSPPFMDLGQSRMTAPIGPEPMRAVAELWLIVGLQDEPDDLSEQFVRPGGHPKRALPGGPWLVDVHPFDRRPVYRSCRTASMMASIFRSDMPSTVSRVTPGVIAPSFR